MGYLDRFVPSAAEIKIQLKRMLDSQRFKKAPNRAMLLGYVVEQALVGISIDETAIGQALFPGWARDESDDVRVTATNLRDSLKKYYSLEGKHDLVVLGLPRGREYKPTFSYNRRADQIKRYMQAQSDFSTLCTMPIDSARSELIDITKHDSKFAPAFAAVADADLRLALVRQSTTERELPRWDFSSFQKWTNKSIGLDEGQWYAHMVAGALSTCLWQWEAAERSFTKAIELNWPNTANHVWYPSYLIALRRDEEALELAGATAEHSPGDLCSHLAFSLLLHVTGQFDEAHKVLGNVFHFRHWAVFLLEGLNWLAMGRPQDAWMLFIRARQSAMEWNDYDAALPSPFSGLLALTGEDEAQKCLETLSRCKNAKTDQMALAYVAVGEYDKAVDCLRKACVFHNPYLVWLHRWPVLKPLHNHVGYQSLVKEMGLPVGGTKKS